MTDAITLATNLIKRFEGCEKRMPDGRLRSYPDPGTGGEPFTIGWGSTGIDISRDTVWTQAQADARLEASVKKFADGVARVVTASINANQRAALISFAYNCGLGNLSSSTLLRLLNAGASKESVGEQFMRWTKAAGKELPGLVKRRAAERALFLTP